MKWNILVGSLVLGASLCTPSFGGGLLDRMLGMKGSGCDSACCDTGCSADPSCGCEMSCGDGCCEPSCGCEIACGSGCCEPSCGCETACGNGCCEPSCGCETACGGGVPSCGCEVACGCDSGCKKPRRRPLMELFAKMECKKNQLFAGLHKSSCDSCCEPTCGCETACGNGCCEPTCGCETNLCDPSCGCETACGDACCGAVPSCGCEVACCDSGCGKKKSCGGLLSKLFKKKSNCCDALACDACGCASACGSAPVAAPVVHGDAAPMPPAPVVDPSAYLQSNRRVIQASSYIR
jgi:hypothetical protein